MLLLIWTTGIPWTTQKLVPKPLHMQYRQLLFFCVHFYTHTHRNIPFPLRVYVDMTTCTNTWQSQIFHMLRKILFSTAVAGHLCHFLCTGFSPHCFSIYVLPQGSQEFNERKRADTSSILLVLKSRTGSSDFNWISLFPKQKLIYIEEAHSFLYDLVTL